LVATARGRILEVGAGTGRNLPYYRHAEELVLSDPDPAMLGRARRRAAGEECPIHLIGADAERLPFPDASFDEVIASLVFCTIPHPETAFAEVRRVLAPGGTLRLLEHVRSPRRWAASLQERLTPLWRRLARGCHLDRDTLATAGACGFVVKEVRRGLDGCLVAAALAVGVPESNQ
jgi:ubiquinone/menaquinone biosynthesis C-methylase UbiE